MDASRQEPGAGDRSAPDPQLLLTALTTEHFTLQGARSQTMSESSARASIFVFSVSSALVALGFIAQISEIGLSCSCCRDTTTRPGSSRTRGCRPGGATRSSRSPARSR